MGLLVYPSDVTGPPSARLTPSSRSTAERFVRDGNWQLCAMAGHRGPLDRSDALVGVLLLKLAVVTLPLAAIFVPRPDGLRSSRGESSSTASLPGSPIEPGTVPGCCKAPSVDFVTAMASRSSPPCSPLCRPVRWTDSPFPRLIDLAANSTSRSPSNWTPAAPATFERLRYDGLTWGLTSSPSSSLPVVLPWLAILR